MVAHVDKKTSETYRILFDKCLFSSMLSHQAILSS